MAKATETEPLTRTEAGAPPDNGPPGDQFTKPARTSDSPPPKETAGQRAVAALLLLIPMLTVALCFWPGHMSADTLAQIDQVRTGDFTNHHAPILMALWRPFYLHLGAGPGWVLTAQLAAFVLGSYLILRALFRPIGAAATVAVVCFLPPVFGMLGYVGRDTWFTALFVLTFGLTVRATQSPWPRRWGWIVAALLLVWLTLASRQNAAAGVVLACIVLAGMLLGRLSQRHAETPRLLRTGPRRLLTATIAGGLLTLTLIGVQFAATALVGTRDVDPEQYLFIYDLAALSERARDNLFPASAMPQRGMQPVDAYWNVDSMNGYVFGAQAPIAAPLPDPAVTALRDRWVEEIGDDPLEYLDVRVDLFLRQLAITRPAMWTYHPVIDGNSYGYEIRFPALNDPAKDYVEAFASPELDGNWIYSVWAYLLVALAAAFALIRRAPNWAVAAAGAFPLAVITYQAGLFFGAMGTQYRFEFPAIVAGALGAALLLRMGWGRLRPQC